MNPATMRSATPKAQQPRQAPTLAAPDLADMQRLTIREVQSLTGRSETSIRDLMKAGRFPLPDYRDGPRCVRWSAGLVRRWLESTRTQA